jgi:hypothetical protein
MTRCRQIEVHGGATGLFPCPSPRPSLIKLWGGLLSFVLLALSGYGQQSVTLAWDPSPDTNVIGYRVYYGAANYTFTNAVDVGDATTGTMTGLVAGVTYYFAVCAYDATGAESDYSNQIIYQVPASVPPSPTLATSLAPDGQVRLAGAGQPLVSYTIRASHDLTTWTVIGTVIADNAGTFGFTDPDASRFKYRFYRTDPTPL